LALELKLPLLREEERETR